MARLSTNELKRLLTEHKCYSLKTGTKHEKWFSPITNRTFLVPRKLKGDGTLAKILRDAGIEA